MWGCNPSRPQVWGPSGLRHEPLNSESPVPLPLTHALHVHGLLFFGNWKAMGYQVYSLNQVISPCYATVKHQTTNHKQKYILKNSTTTRLVTGEAGNCLLFSNTCVVGCISLICQEKVKLHSVFVWLYKSKSISFYLIDIARVYTP